MSAKPRFDVSIPIRTGLLGGCVALLMTLVGIVEASLNRSIIYPVLSMGQTLLFVPFLWVGFQAVRKTNAASHGQARPGWLVGSSALAGLVTGAFLAALVLIGQAIDLRAVFINASPTLYALLTFNQGIATGVVLLLLVAAALGALVAGLFLLPARIRRSLILGLGAIPVISVVLSALFAQRGLSILGTVIVFVAAAGGSYLWAMFGPRVNAGVAALPPPGQRAVRLSRLAFPILAVLLFPLLGTYPSEVLVNVGLFVLLGLGLNIVVGFAGLLDLGYVAFYALGAYTIGILTSPEIGWLPFHLTFWEALPFAVLVATFFGIVLGVPVLGMRGDYLAIVTLGFGEIIRLVALSDWLKPYIGGSNGITRIPSPVLGPLKLAGPQTLYYLLILGCLLVAFVSTRLKDSRLGRAWMAVREDEDVAAAMGINLVRTKLLAFATGAAFSGLSGAIFATKLTSIYPHSFVLMISINVLCVIIVGGMGSNPGVLAGALALVGLPELLREFSEYRLLVYGAALVLMMLTRPEGLIPEARRKLELHEAELDTVSESGKPVSALG